MNDIDHDDGLVHGHSWATEPVLAPLAGSTRPAPIVIPARDDSHDDGLVHDHAWACGERGAMAEAK